MHVPGDVLVTGFAVLAQTWNPAAALCHVPACLLWYHRLVTPRLTPQLSLPKYSCSTSQGPSSVSLQSGALHLHSMRAQSFPIVGVASHRILSAIRFHKQYIATGHPGPFSFALAHLK